MKTESPTTFEVLEWLHSGQIDRLIASLDDQLEIRRARALFEDGLLRAGIHINPHDDRWHTHCIGPEEVDEARKEGFEEGKQEGFTEGLSQGYHDGRKETREHVLQILSGATKVAV